MNRLLFSVSSQDGLERALADRLGVEIGTLTVRSFPDGASYVRFATEVAGRDVALLANLHRPDDKFLPLAFAASTARALGAARVGLIVPYLPYMRPDTRFHPGEAVTSAEFARLLSGLADWLVTVDPHLHRHRELAEIYQLEAIAVRAAPAVAGWVRSNVRSPIVVGPDRESAQWARAVADLAGAPYVVLEKKRRGDREVEVSHPEIEGLRGRVPVLVDDIISTAGTMIETVQRLRSTGAESPVCVGVHAVFADGAYDQLQQSGAARIVTCNTIPHPSNAIDVSALVAEAVLSIGEGDSASPAAATDRRAP